MRGGGSPLTAGSWNDHACVRPGAVDGVIAVAPRLYDECWLSCRYDRQDVVGAAPDTADEPTMTAAIQATPSSRETAPRPRMGSPPRAVAADYTQVVHA
jgi:hypothetical protein